MTKSNRPLPEIKLPSEAEDARIRAAIASDPDTWEVTEINRSKHPKIGKTVQEAALTRHPGPAKRAG